MIVLNIKEICDVCGGRLVGEPNTEINKITTDSRKAEKGSLFAAIAGERVDGHDYIGAAVRCGAAAVLVEKELKEPGVPYIVVNSTLKALQDIAAYILKKADIPVVGIGGSVGKTSTKEAIASVLAQKFSVLKTEGNFNNDLGLPLTVFELTKKHEVAVLEMGISDFGEMHLLASIARPDVCVLTNIGDCHLENLGDRAGVFKAKTEMFDFLKPNGHIVLNGDDDYLLNVDEVNGICPTFYGIGSTNDVWADNITQDGIKGMYCDIHTVKGSITAFVPRPGVHAIYNTLAAASVGLIMGLSLDEIKSGIEAQESVSGRFNIINENSLTIIDDCYNANPMSMKASLGILGKAGTRRVAILGDMGELGDDEAELHAQVGRFAAEQKIDVVVCIGKLSRNILDEAVKNTGTEGMFFDDIKSFEDKMNSIIRNGDTILVKASHFMRFEKIVDDLRNTDFK